ncbi:MAG: aspartate aminotransferase family protein [Planctomycetota bacterium]
MDAHESAQLIEFESRHMSGGFPRRKVVITRGEGARLFDQEGNEFLDLAAANGWGCVGHTHAEVTRAIQDQAARLVFYTEGGFNDQRALWMKELCAVLAESLGETERGAVSIIHPCSSGTEAVEGAIKVARLFTGRPGIVATERGFHGRTLGSLSATWKPHYRDPFQPLVPGFRHVPFNDINALDGALTDDVAAFLLEPVQGEGGVHLATAGFVEALQRLSRERGVLIIADEVQTGLGRTGAWFASERIGLRPDVVALGKALGGGIPMGAVAWREALGKIEAGRHASTFGGNPLACAASRAVLKVVRDERLPERSARLGDRVRRELEARALPMVKEVRGLGLMIGIELDQEVAPVIGKLMERRIWALPAGPRVLRLLPPLVISEEDLNRGVAAISEVLG